MIKAKLTPDNQWIVVETDSQLEKRQLQLSFTQKIPDWFIIKRKYPYANVDECFMNSYGMIPVGLWMALVNVCKKYNFELLFSDDFNCKIKDCSLTRESFDEYCKKLFEKNTIAPKSYQLDGVFNILQYKNCCVEVSTSGGKTLMTYLLFKYAIDVLDVKHILYVTPKTMLTTQSSDKFKEYDAGNKVETTWTSGEIHGAAKKKTEYDENIVFGNYQSLCKKKGEFFKKYDMVIIDEAHHSSCSSIKGIINKCSNAKYKIGLTGTFPKENTYENFVLQSYIGPIVYKLTSYDLINTENFATPVYVNAIELKYLDDERLNALYNLRLHKDSNDANASLQLLCMEKELSRENKLRFNYICNMIINTTKNSLAIFSDVQNGYGKKIYNYVKENSEKNVYYIDGSTPASNREYIKNAMEEDETGNTIIVASMGCFTEGIDIANMWNIFLLESTKSDVTIAQLLGRGMRRHEKKDKTIMIDFIDDMRAGVGYQKDNYLYKHGKERISIYNERRFPCSVFKVDLRNKSGVLI